MRPHPLLFEANARVLVERLSPHGGPPLTLATVPDERWRELGRQFDLLWLMGVWERSPDSRDRALADDGLRRAFDDALPDWTPMDVAGSPYAVRDYRLDPALGSPHDLSALRARLHEAGLALILDFVPNHVARDHPWIIEHPDYFVRPSSEAQRAHSDWYFTAPDGRSVAHGRDPSFGPWTDTAQLNFASRALRLSLIEQLRAIARVCDGVRCDMAMLALNDVFRGTWAEVIADPLPEEEFWAQAIEAVRREHPDFLFIAEAYWGLEERLLELGFDYVYDKELYDVLLRGDAGAVRDHVAAGRLGSHAVLFIENHDEPRAVTAFGRERSLAAAAVAATLPGIFLVHDGQLEGRRQRLPVQLVRGLEEESDASLTAGHARLIEACSAPPVRSGMWAALEAHSAQTGAATANGVLAWEWRDERRRVAAVINYSGARTIASIRLHGPPPASSSIVDRLAPDASMPSGAIVEPGTLRVELGPWQARLLEL